MKEELLLVTRLIECVVLENGRDMTKSTRAVPSMEEREIVQLYRRARRDVELAVLPLLPPVTEASVSSSN
jgi:hypothetical protein